MLLPSPFQRSSSFIPSMSIVVLLSVFWTTIMTSTNNNNSGGVMVVSAFLQEGDTICVEGYVMDFFCIDRGTLFDNPSVPTLEDPGVHSVHCLIDVNSCVTSPYEILLDPSSEGGLYSRGWRLDEESKTTAIALAQSVGSCSTCTDNEINHQTGFRAVMSATIVNLNTDDSSIPPTISVTAMEDTTAYTGMESACQSFFAMEDIVDVATAAAAASEAETESVVDDSSSNGNDEAVVVEVAPLQEGDTVCVEGFIMDFFCIDRGTLFDNPSVRTLENPAVHSVHCLIDVNSCVISPYEVLTDPAQEGQLYSRGWRLDEESKTTAIALAHSVGSCDACTDNEFSHPTGFRAVMSATIVNLNTDDSSIPPIISVNAMEDTTAYTGVESACMTYFPDIIDVAAVKQSSSSSGSGSSLFDGFAVDSNNNADAGVSNKRNKITKMYFAHGSLMMLGWGLFLPSGTIIAKFFKHRPNGLWFRIHRGLQVFGLFLALIGWIIALTHFNVFGDVGFVSYRHGICGMVVMILGLLQPLNAFFRPHAPASAAPVSSSLSSTTNNETTTTTSEETTKSTKRIVWEYWHKGSGWFAVLLAIPTIVLGTFSLPSLDDQRKFQWAYGIGCCCSVLLLHLYLGYDKHHYTKSQKPPEGTAKSNGTATSLHESFPSGNKKEEDEAV